MSPSVANGPAMDLALWILPMLARATAADLACLSAADLQRAARLRQEADRAAFVTSRAALRRGLAKITGLSPGAVTILDRRGRKPDLPDIDDGVDISFSRSDGLALLAVCRGTGVGVDVERVRPWDRQLAAVALSPRELTTIDRDPGIDRSRAFARVWTRKEALLKGFGVGLALDPRRLTVSVTAHPALLACDVAGLSAWALRAPPVDPRWEAAVAVKAAGSAIAMTVHTLLPDGSDG